MNGEYWHSRRKGYAPAFCSKHIKRMNAVAAQKVDEWMESRLALFIEKDEAFDVGKEMVGITLSAISETAFEYTMSDNEMKQYLHDLTLTLKEFIFKESLNPFRKIFGLLFADRREAHQAARRIHALCMRIIESYRRLDDPMKDTVIDRIMTNKAYENDDERVADISGLLIGGHDTTAYTVSWILKELAKHPDEQQKLYESLSATNKEGWDKLEILRKIVKEGMRLHPVTSGGSTRTIGRDFVTDEGYYLPKGTVSMIPFILNLRSPKIFEDANSFLPSRWDNPTEAMLEAFYPFSAGKQNCAGQSLAIAEIHSIVPRICSAFELELEAEGEASYFLTLKPTNTMLRARKRV